MSTTDSTDAAAACVMEESESVPYAHKNTKTHAGTHTRTPT